jgi:uncharacterized protein DUF4282/zinc ribbon protein
MAFCAKCGTQLAAGAAACSACGAPTGVAAPAAPPPAPARYVPPVNAQQAAGFLSSLFDLSFTNFITTKLIKVLFVISIILGAFLALGLILTGFARSAGEGLLMLIIVAPLVFFFYVMAARVQMEVLIVIFRGAEHLEEIARQGRR